jgi:hypothetical protein
VKRTLAICPLLVACLLTLVACGSSSSSSSGTMSGLKTRAFVSNSYGGTIEIVDYTKDALSSSSISTSGQPGPMLVSADRTKTLVFDTAGNSVSIITNSTETAATSIPLPGSSVNISYNSFAISSDGQTAWAAVRNATVTNQADGLVVELDLVNLVVENIIAVPHALHLALSNDNSTLLAFGDDSNNMTVINTASPTTPIVIPGSTTGLDRPVAAYFSSDNSTAYILSCGAGCGGTQAGATPFTVATQTFGTKVGLQAANIGLLNGNALFVAGQSTTMPDGTVVPGVLTPVNVGNGLQLIAGTPIVLGSGNTGIPGALALNGSSLFVGSTQCDGSFVCLAVVNTSSDSLIAPANTQGCSSLAGCQVTGLASIPNRSVVYMVQGGQLYSTDSNTGQLPGAIIPITGKAQDVVVVDQ